MLIEWGVCMSTVPAVCLIKLCELLKYSIPTPSLPHSPLASFYAASRPCMRLARLKRSLAILGSFVAFSLSLGTTVHFIVQFKRHWKAIELI
jgi:hypothetical protein